jgi:type III secretory pathway component EscS
MAGEALADLFSHACLLVLFLSLAPLGASAAAGLVISFLQAITQVQEQTCLYCAKCAGVVAVFALTGRWYVRELTEYLHDVLALVPMLGRL